MNINIQSKSSVPIYEQIKNQIKENIISGIVKEGEPLPSIRNLEKKQRRQGEDVDFKTDISGSFF